MFWWNSFFCFEPDGNIILPGNIVSLSYFGRSCTLRVEAIRGEDGVILQRPCPPPGQDPEEDQSSCSPSSLDSTSTDLSLQMSSLTVDENDAHIPSSFGDTCPTASTPRRTVPLPSLSSPLAPPTPPYNSQNAPVDSQENPISVETSVNQEQAETIPTAPSGGALSTDTFYCLSCSTKVSFKDRAGQDTTDAQPKSTKVTYSMIGGLSSQMDVIRETIELPLKNPELFSNYGTSLPR